MRSVASPPWLMVVTSALVSLLFNRLWTLGHNPVDRISSVAWLLLTAVWCVVWIRERWTR